LDVYVVRPPKRLSLDIGAWCYDQGDTPECTAYAVAAARTALGVLASEGTQLFDAASFYTQEESPLGNPDLLTLRWAIEQQAKFGLVPLASSDKAPTERAEDAKQYAVPMSCVQTLPFEDHDGGYRNSIVQCISQGVPVLIQFHVGLSFEDPSVAQSGVWNGFRDHIFIGQHAALVYGYDLSQNTCLVRNSYGPDWGHRGDFTMPLDGVGSERIVFDAFALHLPDHAAVEFDPPKTLPVQTPHFGTPESFLAELGKPATALYDKTRCLFASVTLAQSALETGWLKFLPVDFRTGRNSFNIYGVKGEGPAGSVYDYTFEYLNNEWVRELAQFAAYESYLQSMLWRSRLLLSAPRYAPVREAKTPCDQCRALQSAGYATDPTYADQLIQLIEEYRLDDFDVLPKDPPRRTLEVSDLSISQLDELMHVLETMHIGGSRIHVGA